MEMQVGWALAIDADTDAQALYRQVLGEAGFDIDTCDRGASASLLMMRRAYALILLDPCTPGICGLEILSYAYRQPSPAPIIVVGQAALNGPDTGAPLEPTSQLLCKPFTADDLRQLIERVFREQHDRKQLALHAAADVRLCATSDLAPLYDDLVRVLLAKFKADRTSLMLWSGDSDQIGVAASAGFPIVVPGKAFAPLHGSVAGWVIRHVEPLLLDPDRDLPFDFQRAWRNDAIYSGICVPLVASGQVLGVLAIARRAGRARFTSADLDHMSYLANQVAAMLEHARLQAQLQYRIQLMAGLNSLATALLAASDLDRLLQVIVEQLAAVLPDAQGYLFLREAGSPWIDRLQIVGEVDLPVPRLEDLRDQPGLAGQVLADGVPRLHKSADLRQDLAAWEQRLLLSAHQLLCVAFKTDTAVYGAIELVSHRRAFDEEDLQFMVALAALVAPAIEKSQIYAAVARSASRYDAMFHHAANAILLIDQLRSTIVAANPAAERMSGYSQVELALISPALLIAPAMPAGRLVVPVSELLAGTLLEYEGYICTRNGYSVPVSIAVNQVLYQANCYLQLVMRNTSEAQRTAQRLALSEKLAGMTRLTASIAHEVNNPLQALHNTLHLLLNRSFTEEKRERLLSMAQMEVDRLTVIVRRMLELHRPSHDAMRPVSIHNLLEGALASVSAQLQQHQVRITRDWAEQLPFVNGIGGHLKQVFQDLAINAADAMPNGGQLLVRTRLEESQGNHLPPHVLVDFVDTGPGIPESETKLIFEPFYTTKHGSPGLGLAISYSIIERHSGTITVSSSSAGTTFRIALPVLVSAA